MRTYQPRIIFIDWSGVVSNDRLPVYETNSLLLESCGIARLSYDEWLAAPNASLRELFGNHDIQMTDEESYGKFEATYAEVTWYGMRPTIIPGAQDFLSKMCKKKPVVVISAHPTFFLIREAESYGVHEHVHKFLGSCTDKAESIRQELGKRVLFPSEAVYIGDMASDVRAAKRAGVTSIAVTTGYHSRERLLSEKPDLIVSSLPELLDHLK